MSRIFSRSPYIVEIDESGQTSSKIELTLWTSGVEPNEPQYILSKNIPASNLTQTLYNVSPYIREYFDFNEYSSSAGSYGLATPVKFRVNVRIKRFATTSSGESELDNTLYYAFDGFGKYEEGNNPDLGQVLLSQGTYSYHKTNDYNSQAGLSGSITIDAKAGDVVTYTKLNSNIVHAVTIATDGVKEFDRLYTLYRGFGNRVSYTDSNGDVIWTATFKPIEECKYTPVYIDFINRYGAWSRMFMYKTSKKSLSVTSNDYNLMQSSLPNYDVKEGQRKQFNVNGQESIKVNSGWVHEDFGSHLQELIMSERVLVNNRPAKCKTTSLDIQTGLDNKTISYSLDFDFNNDFINSVV